MIKKSWIWLLILFITISTQTSYGASALTYEEIEAIIEEVAIEKNIPPVILKAIAWKESGYNQFNSSGAPFVSRGNTGIMQVNRVHRHLDQEKLKYDIKYNIEAGADILLGRWYAAGTVYPTIGNMDPMVLEHWYFALWGYNGWVARNNPNVSGDGAFQEEIYQLIRDKFNQPITSIDPSLLPLSGLPDGNLHIPTPQLHHYAVIEPEEPAVFQDLVDHPQQKYVEALFHLGVVSGVSDELFMPDEFVTRAQMAKLLVDGLELDTIYRRVAQITDFHEAEEWAKPYISIAYQHGYLFTDEADQINPQDFLTREEAFSIIYLGMQEEEAYYIEKEILSDQGLDRPTDLITRADLCQWLYQIIIGN